MKHVFSLIMALMLTFSAFAQKDVTKFLGIPVDGTKAQMIAKLKAKGFTPEPNFKNVLKGTFNGRKVNVHVVTNGNKVYRIMVTYQSPVSETDIKINFNILCKQFSNNKKYLTLEDYTIPETERISHEMIINQKRYEAAFYQLPTINDSVKAQKNADIIKKNLLTKYTEDQLANPTEEIQEEIKKEQMNFFFNDCSKRPVWFIISKSELSYDKYSIILYYDNVYNDSSNGEDL